MRKAEMIPKEIKVIYCDICKEKTKRCEISVCSICDRDICDNCWPVKSQLSGIWYCPCPICKKIKKKYHQRIKQKFKESEMLRDEGIDILREWKKESLKNGKENK